MKRLIAIVSVLALLLCTGAAPAQIILGVHLPPGPYPQGVSFADAIEHFWDATGKKHPLVMFFLPYDYPADGLAGLAAQVLDLDAVPLITWEFYAGNYDDSTYSLGNIAGGEFDAAINSTAEALAALNEKGEIILRVLHEFDTTCYPWGVPRSWNGSSEEFKDAFRHIVDLFRAKGADNVKFMWSPNYMSNVQDFDIWACYPGDEYVDCAGTSGLNDTPSRFIKTPGYLFYELLWNLARNTRGTGRSSRSINSKPQILAEFGSIPFGEAAARRAAASGYTRDGWIKDSYGFMAGEFPCLSAVCWFNGTSNYGESDGLFKDFRVVANPGESPVPSHITEAYKEAISDSRFLEEWPGLAALARPDTYPPLPVNDGTPSIYLVFNKPQNAVFRTGDVILAAYFLSPYGDPDAYLVAQLPSGALMSYCQGRFINGIKPAVEYMPVHRDSRGMIILYSFSGTEPAAGYSIYSGFAPAGSKNPAGEHYGEIGKYNFRFEP